MTKKKREYRDREGHLKSRKVIMSLGVAKEYDLREVRWVGSAHPAESKEYYNSKGKKMDVKVFLRPFEVNPSSEATVFVRG
jgi:hypothetical protein